VTHHGFGHAAEKRPLRPPAIMAADDEQVCGPLRCGLHDLLGRRADWNEFQDGWLRRQALTDCGEQPLGIELGGNQFGGRRPGIAA
jgi:hypothetical protein